MKSPKQRVQRLLGVWVVLLVSSTCLFGAVTGMRYLMKQPTSAAPRPATYKAAPAPEPYKPKIAGTGPATVWVFGDSICSGQGLLAAQAWPARLAARANLTVINWCRPGYAFSGYLGTVSDELDAAYASGLPVSTTVIVAAGSNDLGIHDATSIAASEWAALAVQRSLLEHGAQRVLFAAVIPRGDGHEQLRQQFNMWQALTFSANYEQVDFFYNPPFKAKYYQPDRLHPNTAGAQLISDTFDTTRIIR